MSLIKSTVHHLQKRSTIAIVVPIFFTLTGLQLSSVLLRTTKTWNSQSSDYGLCGVFNSIAAFISHPYALFKRISLRPADNHPGRSFRKLDGQKYWKAAVRSRRKFRHDVAPPTDVDPFDSGSGDASSKGEYVITYYQPQLLPQYREHRQWDADALELVIPPKVFIGWYALVHPYRIRPSVRRASKLLNNYSTRDRREILRISQLAKKEGGGTSQLDGTYRRMWKEYLRNKGPDIVICFAS